MLIVLTHSSQRAQRCNIRERPMSALRCERVWNERVWPIARTTALLNPQLCTWVAAVILRSLKQHMGQSTCPRGQIFVLMLSETSATSLRGCEFGLLTRSMLGLAWAMQLYIEDIVIGIKRPGHCMKNEAVCCGLHKSNRVPNVGLVALTTLPRFLICWKCWGTLVQREQIFCRTAQMHNVRLVDNFL